MRHYVKLFFLIAITMVIASCSSIYGDKGVIQNRGTDYLKARSIPPLKIPPGISSSSIHTQYPVSDRDYPGQSKDVNLTPPGL